MLERRIVGHFKVSCGDFAAAIPSRAMETNLIHSQINYLRCNLQALGDKLAAADYLNLTAQLDAIEKQPIYPGFKARYLLRCVLQVQRQLIDKLKTSRTST
jgi:hypothetical protein